VHSYNWSVPNSGAIHDRIRLTVTDSSGKTTPDDSDDDFAIIKSFTASSLTPSYDKLSRLTQILFSDNSKVIYSYDAVGNRLTLVGVKGQPKIAASPTALNFGNVAVGSTADQTLTISNTGSADLNIDAIKGALAPFSVVTDNCAFNVVQQSSNCTIKLRFAPASKGSFSNTLYIQSDVSRTPTLSVTLTGSGI